MFLKKMTHQQLIETLNKGERLTLEAKSAKTELPRSIWESYSAFANTIGGTILLGISENRKENDPVKRFAIVGVDDTQKILTDFWNTINSNKVSANILTDSDVEVLTFDLPRPFRMEGIRRIDDTPQHKAVREAFTNAIIHSDVFLEGGVLRIDKYDDKLVFRNPGTLKLPIEQIYEGGLSKARNPRIQNMLRMIGFGENLGSGFPMILNAWKQTGWKAPLLENKIEVDEVALTLFVYDKAAQTSAQTSAQTTKSSLTNGLTDSQTSQTITQTSQILPKLFPNSSQTRMERVLQLIKENPLITKRELAKLIGCTERTIQVYITKLKVENRLRRIGPATLGGRWEVVENDEIDN